MTDLPAFGAGDWGEFGPHLEAGCLGLSPPPGQPRQIRATRIPVVDEAAADRARSGVEILVAAPYREVGVPIVQRQQCIAHRMRQVQAHGGADAVRRGDQRFDVQALAGQILNSRQQDQRETRPLALDEGDQIFVP